MNATVLGIISSVCAMVIGLWKFFAGKERRIRKKEEEGLKNAKEGNSSGDSSKLTAGVTRMRNARKRR